MRSILLIQLWRPWLDLFDRVGRFFHWATSEGRPTFFGLVSLAAATLASQLAPLPKLWLLPTFLAVGLFVAWAWHARRSIIIDDFEDHTTRGRSTVGTATLLSTELARMRNTFRVVDERNALETAVGEGAPLDAAVKVDDLSEVIHRSVTPETKLRMGPIEIPIGTGMLLLGRIVQGPRLRCQLHERGEQLVLTAQLSGLRRRPVWSIGRTVDGSSTDDCVSAVHDMIPELAARMFTNVGMKHKVKWQAMAAFTAALRLYRSCLRTPRDRAVKLLDARRHLVEAIAEDEDFVLVYYNLGVIYNELSRIAERAGRLEVSERHRNAARTAFTKAVERAPDRWESYYALARIHFTNDATQAARELCERVLELRHRRGAGHVEKAKAHDLIGRTYVATDPRGLAHHRRACKLALRALRKALIGRHAEGSEDDPVPTLRDLAANCLASLASAEAQFRLQGPPGESAGRLHWWIWRQRARFDRITALIKLAEHLTSKDANLHFQLGRIASDWHAYDLAIRELSSAARIEPDRALFLAHLAAAHRRRGAPDDIPQASADCLHAFAAVDVLQLPDPDDRTLDLVSETLDELGDVETRARLEEMRRFAADARELPAWLSDKPVRSQLAAAAAGHRRANRLWEAGHLYLMLGKRDLENRDSVNDAEANFRAALDCFDAYPKDVARHDVRALLARALAIQGKRDEALREAEQAISISPMSSFAHASLGHVYNAAGDLEKGRDAWNDALLWSPDDPDLHWELGFCNWRLGQEVSPGSARQSILKEAEQFLRQAAVIFPNERFDDRIRIHYWLARLYDELGEFDKVVSNLRIVQMSPRMSIVADFLVAEAYGRLENYNAAEHLLRSVIAETERFDEADDEIVMGAEDVLEAWPLSVLRAEARCALAASHAGRDGDLDEARWQLGRVKAELQESFSLTSILDEFPEKRLDLLAAYHHACGRLRLQEGDVEAGLRELSASIAHKASAEPYLDLALGYWRQALVAAEPEQALLAERVRRYCALVRATDLRAVCTPVTDDLLARLDRWPSHAATEAELAADAR